MTRMPEPARIAEVVAAVEAGFARTPSPGERFLQGSTEGCEPGESIDPFRAFTDWRDVPAETLDANDAALSFFSEGGFRFFLPAYLIADLRGQLRTADPLSHLTGGFSTGSVQVTRGGRTFDRRTGETVLLNPRRYGAMTFGDYTRFRMSVFCREEARAIVRYLEHRRETADLDIVRETIDRALERYWLDRAASAPTAQDLADHLEGEQAFLKAMAQE